MTTIVALAQDQVLTATLAPKLACNNRNTVKLLVTFSPDWNSYAARSAIFTTSVNPTPYEAVLANGECTIPHEVLADAGLLYIYVRGVNANTNSVKTTTPIAYKVQPGTPSLIVSAPTADVYQQLWTQIATMHSRLSTAESAVTVDSEVQGIRNGADGTIYATAGDAVRGQIEDLRAVAVKENLIKDITPGYLTVDGEIFSSKPSLLTSERTTEYIAVDSTLPYVFTFENDIPREVFATICFYDANKTFMRRAYIVNLVSASRLAQKVAIDSGAAFVRFSWRSYMLGKATFQQSAYACSTPTKQASENLIEAYPLIHDGFLLNSGGLSDPTQAGYVDGEPALVEKYTEFMPVSAGQIYHIYQNATKYPWARVCVHDSAGAKLTDITIGKNGKTTVTIPEGAYAMRMCARTYYLNDFAVFKEQTPMCAEQRVRENYLNLVDISENAPASLDDTVKAVNHRGFANAPENTLSAYRLSKKKGFVYVECDVSFTSDGVAVLLHDSTVDRTSNGTGSIATMTFSAVRALDFGSWKSAEYAGEKIPTFEEFIVLCKRLGLHPYIEVKTGTETQIKGLYDTVRLHGMKGKVTWISFNSAYLGYIKEVDTKARLGYVVDGVDSGVITAAKELLTAYNEVFIDCSAGNANATAVKLCADADLPLEVWTVNTESAIIALNGYVSGVTSDNLIAGKVLADNAMSE